MKKRALSILLVLVMLMSMLPVQVLADDGASEETPQTAAKPVEFTKTLVPATENAPAKIKLEAYTTGATSTSTKKIPTDIVLVLDQSGSMDDRIGDDTKLSIMKAAVENFVDQVAAMNNEGNLYRVAIVGFASESGYSDNSEILTVTKTATITSTEYVVVTGSLDTSKTYYIRDGQAYRAIRYENGRVSGWYTTGRQSRRIDVNNYTIYERKDVVSDGATTYGVAFNDLTVEDYSNALVNCTTASIAQTGTIGIIGGAIAALDGNGATRTDLGMEMAAEIFAAQPAGTYDSRNQVVVLITDGVPTTHTNFDSDVANYAVEDAKGMKDGGAHIFSMYLGTPASESVNFLQAVSSNYPNATSISSLGDQAATTYYSAHTDSSAIQAMFTGIVGSITANSTLNEQSVVQDTLTDYFELAADLDTTGTSQIEVYTVEKTATGWANTEQAFSNATVTIGGEDNKTISVTGFNFASHCITESPKDGANGSDYGRKLVIYIPIVEDETADTFGGWVPTNEGAGIYQDSSSETPTVTAETEHSDLAIQYSLNAAERAFHVDGTTLSDPVTYTVDLTQIDDAILDEMIQQIPDGKNNQGVTMTYKLYDIGTADKSEGNLGNNDDVLVATLSVPAGGTVDVTAPENWTWETGKTSVELTIPAGQYFAEKVYVLTCTLTSTKQVTEPEKAASLTVYNYLDLSVVRGNLAHIVYGTIDENGQTTVGTEAPGSLVGNTYTEAVTAGNNSAVMTFAPLKGYEIVSISYLSSNEKPLDTEHVIYSKDSSVSVTDVDLNGDGNADKATLTPDGKWSFQAYNVTKGVAVEVSTQALTYTLITSDDAGSEIINGTTYTYHATDKLNVPFQAIDGNYLTKLEVNNEVYDLMSADDRKELANKYGAELKLADGTDIVVGGHVLVPRTQDNEVHVQSAVRSYNVTLKYYIKNSDGTYSEQTGMKEGPTAVQFGTKISDTESPLYWPGDQKEFDDHNYTLSDWYRTYDETLKEFYNVVNLGAATMPAYDLTLYAIWTKNPDVEVAELTIQKNVDALPDEETAFNFLALYHEHQAGTATITIPATGKTTQTATMEIILTDSQAKSFRSGNGYIYIYEVPGDAGDVWNYDNTSYELHYEDGAAVLYKGTEKVDGYVVAFNNKHKTLPNVTVDKVVSKVNGEAYTTGVKATVGSTIEWTITLTNTGEQAAEVSLTDVLTAVSDNTTGERTVTLSEADSDGLYNVPAKNGDTAGTRVVTATYKVTEDDWGKTLNNVVVSSYDDDDKTETPPKTDEDEAPGVEVEDYTVTVKYFIEDAQGEKVEISDPTNQVNPFAVQVGKEWKVADSTADGVNYVAPKNVTVSGKNYIYETATPSLNGTMKAENVVVNLYYTIDEIGEEDKPDGIPDKYQATIIYIAEENGSLGTENGQTVKETKQVVTLKDSENNYAKSAQITAEKTAVPDEHYVSEGWTVEEKDAGAATTAAIGAKLSYDFTAQGGKTYIFRAKFDAGDHNVTVTKTVAMVGSENVFDQTNIPKANVGDTILWAITLKNNTPHPVSNITVSDVLKRGDVALNDAVTLWNGEISEGNEVKATDVFSLDSLSTLTFIAEYQVQKDDVNKTLTNIVTATIPDGDDEGEDPDPLGQDESEGVDVVPTSFSAKKYLVVDSQDIAMEGALSTKYTAAPGETITWKIVVTNTSDSLLENIEVKDVLTAGNASRSISYVDMENDNVEYANGVFKILSLPVNGSENIVVTYKVAEDGSDAGKEILNKVVYDPDGEDGEDPKEDPAPGVTVEKKGIDVTKTVDKTVAEVDEVITYTLTVVNTGNVALTNVVLKDELTSASGTDFVYTDVAGDNVSFVDGKFVISELTLDAPVIITYTYTVKAADANSTIKNKVTIEKPDIPDDNPDDNEEEVEVKKNPGLVVEKEVYAINDVLAADKNSYQVETGDEVTWSIKVTNTGNVKLENVSVKDTLTVGSKTVTLDVYDKMGSDAVRVETVDLEVGGEVTLYASYTVKAEDAGKTLSNSVVVKGSDGNSDPTDDPQDEDTNDEAKVEKPDAPVVGPLPSLNKKDHVAYIIGYEDETVRPQNNITRAEVATIFFRLLTDDSRAFYWSQVNDFSDVSKNDWFNNAVSTMSNAGIITGYPDGTFGPNKPITRAEFAAIAARFSDVVYNGESRFTDVLKSHWAWDEIALAEHLGWITGYPDDTFRPDRNITRAEAMTLINRVLERAVEEEHMLPDMVTWIDNRPTDWFYEAVQEATNSHAYTRLNKRVPDQSFNFEDWVKILEVPDWAALEKSWSTANSN